jgi:phosphatidylglycerol:prolipoprotein diacylglycerol transferase
MHPELFRIPFTQLTVKSYGLMVVIGFICAVWVIDKLVRRIGTKPELVTNAALYALVAGIFGARVFFVIHYWDQFAGSPLRVFAIWEGGLELLGGAILAIVAVIFYLRHYKLHIRKHLDILAIGLLIALGFGRIGCLLNGCCYGKPTNSPLAIEFPYGSFAYQSQISPDKARGRSEARISLSEDFFGYQEGQWWNSGLKPFDKLTPEQQQMVTDGPYKCLAVHPTQLYSSVFGFFWAFVFWCFLPENGVKKTKNDKKKAFFARNPGCIFAMTFVVYSVGRFLVEILRDDNPFEIGCFTISQILSFFMFLAGWILFAFFIYFPFEK